NLFVDDILPPGLEKYLGELGRGRAGGFKFTLVFSRRISEREMAILLGADSAVPLFGADTLPTNADVPVTKMDFDDTVSPSLEEAIQAGLDSVENVPEL